MVVRRVADTVCQPPFLCVYGSGDEVVDMRVITWYATCGVGTGQLVAG